MRHDHHNLSVKSQQAQSRRIDSGVELGAVTVSDLLEPRLPLASVPPLCQCALDIVDDEHVDANPAQGMNQRSPLRGAEPHV